VIRAAAVALLLAACASAPPPAGPVPRTALAEARARGQQGDLSLTAGQAALAAAGDPVGYWTLRLAQGDPVALVSLAMQSPRSTGAVGFARARLIRALPGAAPGTEFATLARAVARAHAAMLAEAGPEPLPCAAMPGPRAVATLHHRVMSAHGLPTRRWAGTPLTGRPAEALLTAPLWYLPCGPPP